MAAEKIKVIVRRAPPEISPTLKVTATSDIPLWACVWEGCLKIPCTVNTPGQDESLHISWEKGGEDYFVLARTEDKFTIPFDHRGYTGTLSVDPFAGTAHVNLDKHPPPQKMVGIRFAPSGYIVDIKGWSRVSTPCTYDCVAEETSPGVFECIATTGIQYSGAKFPEWLCEHGKLVITLKAGVWTIDTEKTSDRLVRLLTPVGTATGITLTIAPKPKISDIKITVDSPIPLFYRDENDVYPLPVEKTCLFDLGFAICDARYEKNECWEGWPEECVIYKDYITEYTGVVNKTIYIRGYRGTVRIDFTTIPYTMHVVILEYPPVGPPKPEWMGVGGHVRDKETDRVITEGRIIHVETGESVSIDHTGYYDFDIVKYTGLQHYRAEVAGYDTLAKEVVVTKDRTDRLDFELAKAPPKPVTITPSELRWTDGTYRAAFRINNLVPTTRYRIVLLDAKGNEIEANRVTGVYSTDIRADILKSDLDEFGYKISCSVYNTDTGVLEKNENYVVPPYTIKGSVDISRSTIPTTIYLEESAVFDMMVENTGDMEKECAIVLTFKNVDTGEEFKFTPDNTIRVPARGAGLNRVSVVMPSEAIPKERESQTFDLLYKLEIW